MTYDGKRSLSDHIAVEANRDEYLSATQSTLVLGECWGNRFVKGGHQMESRTYNIVSKLGFYDIVEAAGDTAIVKIVST